MRLSHCVAGCAAAAVIALSVPAQATVVTYDFTAGAYSGSVSYDTTAQCFSGCSNGAGYAWYTDSNFTATVDYQGKVYTFATDMVIDYNYFGTDSIEFYDGSSPFGYFDLDLSANSNKGPLSGLQIPTSISAAAFPDEELYIGSNSDPIASFTKAAAVPEPASMSIMGAGLAGLFAAIRRRRGRAGVNAAGSPA